MSGIYAVGALAFTALPLSLVVGWLPADDTWDVVWAWAISAFWGAGALILLVAAVRGAPRLVLTDQGLEHTTVWHRKTWRWSELGPFSRSTKIVETRHGKEYHHYLCAYSDEIHDDFASHGISRLPTSSDGEVIILLNDLRLKGGDETGSRLQYELNAWRRRYGSPEVEWRSTASRGLRGRVEAVRRGSGVPDWLWLAVVVVLGVAVWHAVA